MAIEVEVSVKAKTDKAWLCDNGKTEAWIPVSQIEDYSEDSKGEVETIFINRWLAEEKELV